MVLARRSIMVRYRQTVIGATWAVVQPFLMMIVFTVFLGMLAGLQTGRSPYPVVVYTGLLVWGAVSKTVSEGTSSVIAEAGLIRQVYFPRIYCPVASGIGSLVDFGFGLVALAALLLFYGMTPSVGVLAVPLFLAIAYAAALGLAMWLSALNTAYRDVGHLLPFLLQVWMFTSPVIYESTIVPQEYRLLYATNPLVGAIDGFRWAFAGGPPPEIAELVLGAIVALALLISGYIFFRYREPMFADQV
jgi:lipopolysaccharide transport system permease protein